MTARAAWALFCGAAVWIVAGFGFVGWMLHRTRGGLNWDDPPVTDAEKPWMDAVQQWKERQRA